MIALYFLYSIISSKYFHSKKKTESVRETERVKEGKLYSREKVTISVWAERTNGGGMVLYLNFLE